MNDFVLDEKYRIRNDSHSVILEKKQEGKKHWSPKYYPDFKSALKQYLEEHINGSTTAKEILRRITEVERKIDSLPDAIQSLSKQEIEQMQAHEQGI